MKRVHLQPAYVLHRRPYRETSFLAELFTPHHGRLTVVARGARKSRSPASGLLQPFVPLLVSFAGKGELMALSHVEANGTMRQLEGECLFAGFYLNELLVHLLQKWDAHPGLYAAYENAVSALQGHAVQQKILRSFEKCLLEEIGYGLLPKSENSLHNTFSPELFYRFMPEHGFVVCEPVSERGQDLSNDTGGADRQSQANLFSGKSLIAIAKDEWQDEACLRDAKRLTRFVLAPLLGNRPIHSRRLFMQMDEGEKHEK